MLLAELNREKRSSKKGIEWALWLYGSMALWLYGSMALWLYGSMAHRRRLKNIFIASKLRLMQLFQIVENHKTKNYSVLQNSAERGYLLSTASGNLLRIAGWCYFVEKISSEISKSPQCRSQFYWAGRKSRTVKVMPEKKYFILN